MIAKQTITKKVFYSSPSGYSLGRNTQILKINLKQINYRNARHREYRMFQNRLVLNHVQKSDGC